MSQTKNYDFYFKASSVLTKWLPRTGAGLLNETVPAVMSNRFIIRRHFNQDMTRLKKIAHFHKILVIADLNIGDAVN